jgi:hypothetical protein
MWKTAVEFLGIIVGDDRSVSAVLSVQLCFGEVTSMIEIQKYIDNSLTYQQYIGLIDDLLLEGKTTGPNQSYKMFQYGKLNRQRMRRLEKTFHLEGNVKREAASVTRKMIWLVITEGWCGDAAQNVPLIEKLTAENHRIETRYILRDENPELMDQFLTNGARSIPKLIAIDRATGEILGTWGPRPVAAQEYFNEMRSAGIESSLIKENLQRWYLADRGESLQGEFVKLLAEWSRQSGVAKAA